MGMWIYKIIAFSIGVGCASSENSSPPFAHAGATPFASREGMGRGFLPKDPSPVQGRDRCRLLHTEEWSLRYDRAQWKSPFRPSENQSFTSIILFSGAFRNGEGVAQDMDAAKRYLNQAVELGDQEAVEVLKQIKEKEDSCFITTAASRILGWADQGPELTRFRAFRDETLRSDDAGEEEVKWYYDFAPHIVASIESSTDAESVWAAVAHEHLEPIDQLLLAGDGQGAHAKYRHMVLRLAGRFLPPTVPLPAGSIRNPL